MKPRIIIGLSGASGIQYAAAALRLLRARNTHEIHLIVSPAALRTMREETDLALADLEALADEKHAFRDIAAPLASGSFRVDGMLIAPCSVRTLGAIATSLGDNLLVRAADVCLKERRRLVLMLRETPFHLGHIELMRQVTLAGAIVMPPVPAFYTRPQTIDDIVTQTAARALDLLGIDVEDVVRWPAKTPPRADA